MKNQKRILSKGRVGILSVQKIVLGELKAGGQAEVWIGTPGKESRV